MCSGHSTFHVKSFCKYSPGPLLDNGLHICAVSGCGETPADSPTHVSKRLLGQKQWIYQKGSEFEAAFWGGDNANFVWFIQRWWVGFAKYAMRNAHTVQRHAHGLCHM